MKILKDKGVAGVTVLLSLVTILFIIGLLAMIFALMGGELANATEELVSASASENVLFTNGTGTSLSAPVDASISNEMVYRCIGLGC